MWLCSAWLVHANNGRGFVVKLSEMGLPAAPTQQLPITAVSHAAPEVLSQVRVLTFVS